MLELTHVHVLFRNSHLAYDFNFNVNKPVRVEVEVYVDFATSLLTRPYVRPSIFCPEHNFKIMQGINMKLHR